MIAYIISGSGFGGCVDYVTRRKLEEKLYKELSKGLKVDERKYESNRGEDIIDHLSKDWKLISSSGDIRIYEGRKAMADDIARPSRQRKPIKDPVGHISLDFHPEDKPRMTDELMAEVAQDYMRQMGLVNTPYIVVRHFDKAHPHCHIVFSRVDYEGKILTQTTNFKKNERVCKALNLKHRLMQGKSKLNTDVSKLRGKEKVRYQLVHDIARVYLSPSVTDWDSFVDWLHRNGITVREKTGKSGRVNLYFGVGGQEFWYRKLDPFFSRENLELKFKARREKLQEATPRPKGGQQPVQERRRSMCLKRPRLQVHLLYQSQRSNRNRLSYRHCRMGIWERGLRLTNSPATKKAMPFVPTYASPMKLSANITGSGMISRQPSLDVSLRRHPQTVISLRLSNSR